MSGLTDLCPRMVFTLHNKGPICTFSISVDINHCHRKSTRGFDPNYYRCFEKINLYLKLKKRSEAARELEENTTGGLL